MVIRCDYCRGYCGFHDEPALVRSSGVVNCLYCFNETVDEHNFLGWLPPYDYDPSCCWVSSESEPDFDEDEPYDEDSSNGTESTWSGLDSETDLLDPEVDEDWEPEPELEPESESLAEPPSKRSKQ